ncbi:MAG: hypothetical protein ACXWT3_09835, partial [Methylococcaceae bacterium]
KFPLEETIQYYKGRTKSITFSEDDIDGLLDLQYGQPKTYCALTILYSVVVKFIVMIDNSCHDKRNHPLLSPCL